MKQSAETVDKLVRHIQLQVPAEVCKKFRSFCLYEDINMRAKVLQLIEEYTYMRSKTLPKMNKKEIYGGLFPGRTR